MAKKKYKYVCSAEGCAKLQWKARLCCKHYKAEHGSPNKGIPAPKKTHAVSIPLRGARVNTLGEMIREYMRDKFQGKIDEIKGKISELEAMFE